MAALRNPFPRLHFLMLEKEWGASTLMGRNKSTALSTIIFSATQDFHTDSEKLHALR